MKRLFYLLAFAIGLMLVVGPGASHYAAAKGKGKRRAKLDSNLQRLVDVEKSSRRSAKHRRRGRRVPVIIQTHGPPTIKHARSVRRRRGRVGRRFRSINGFVAKVPVDKLSSLTTDHDILKISADMKVQMSTDITAHVVGATALRPQKSLDDDDDDNEDGDSSIITGKGVTVACVDTGVVDHPDLKRKEVEKFKDFVAKKEKPYDDNGHGSIVNGIIRGSGKKSSKETCFYTYMGIAPKSSLVAVKALDANGVGTVSDVIKAIEWCTRHRDDYGIRVLNLSLGHPIAESYTTDPLCLAVKAAWEAGIVVVVSAGNRGQNGYATINSPGNSPWVVTVGATNTHGTDDIADDTMASYSSRGPTVIDHVIKPDIVAPGNHIISLRAKDSTYDATHPENRIEPAYYDTNPHGHAQYYHLSGTSMAAAVVSGAVALMLEANPSLTPDTVKARLMLTARKKGLGCKNNIYTRGAGLLDIPAAIASDFTPTAGSLSPTAFRIASRKQIAIVPTAVVLANFDDFYGPDPTTTSDDPAVNPASYSQSNMDIYSGDGSQPYDPAAFPYSSDGPTDEPYDGNALWGDGSEMGDTYCCDCGCATGACTCDPNSPTDPGGSWAPPEDDPDEPYDPNALWGDGKVGGDSASSAEAQILAVKGDPD